MTHVFHPPKPYRTHLKTLMSLGLPLVGVNLAAMSVQIIDTIMLGRYNIEALAGAVLGGSFYFVLFVMGAGFSNALMPVIAADAAAGHDVQVRRTTRMTLWLSMLFVGVTLPLTLNGEAIFLALGQEEGVASEAGKYLWLMGFVMVPALLINTFKSYLAALERAQIVFWVTVASAALNGLLNYAFIFGNWGAPELGIVGAALGSLISQIVSAVVLLIYALRVAPEQKLLQRLWRPDWEAFWAMFALGWPVGLTSLAEVALFSASAVMVGWVGAVQLAAHGIVLQIASVTFMVHLGLAHAATVRAGNAFGRKDSLNLRRGALVASLASAGFALICSVLFIAAPDFLINLFLDPLEPARDQVLTLGATLLVLAALFQLADGGQAISLGLLRGLQDMRVPMIHATISYWLVGLTASYIMAFPLGFGAAGVWAGLVAGLASAWVLMGLRFWRQKSWLR